MLMPPGLQPRACPVCSSVTGGTRRAFLRDVSCFPPSKGCSMSSTTRPAGIPATTRSAGGLMPYVRIARVDHWFKNAFMLLGVVLALFYHPEIASLSNLLPLAVAVLSTCLVASSNYVLNELL